MESTDPLPPLLNLPAELIHQILAYLPPVALAQVASTCRLLHDHASTDQLWQPLVNANLHEPLASPGPLSSFRELYVAHHPYWFLPRHKLWLSDAEPSGKLLVARYDPFRGCIEAYAVVAQRGPHTFQFWSHDSNVVVHSFNPRVQLDLNQPVLKLNIDSPRAEISHSHPRHAHGGIYPPRYAADSSDSDDQDATPPLSREILMDCSAPPGLCTTFLLARDYPAALTNRGTAVWPPLELPAPSRTRNSSSGGYASSGHRPSKHSEVSQNTFRLRKWVEFHGRRESNYLAHMTGLDRLSAALGLGFGSSSPSVSGMGVRMGEEVATFGTLSPEAYTPTPSKPWRGIWCGDYSGHGCEFLALLQPESDTEGPLPAGMDWMREWLQTGRRVSESSRESAPRAEPEEAPAATDDEGENAIDFLRDYVAVNNPDARVEDDPTNDIDNQESVAIGNTPDTYSGRLLAVKLTGDPNIPRGQYTFIAPDVGEKGYVRTAQEELFRGARVVRSAGHIAERGFRNGKSRLTQ